MTRTTWTLLAVTGLLFGSWASSAWATEYHFNPNTGTTVANGGDWWMNATNWTLSDLVTGVTSVPNGVNDIAVWDVSPTSGGMTDTNVHSAYYTVQELRFNLSTPWTIANARQDPILQGPSGTALITQNGAGTVTFGSDLIFNSSTTFGGIGSGNITVNGSGGAAYQGTIRGAGGLTMNGNYALTFNTPVSYQGPTVINSGSVIYNADSLTPLPGTDDQNFTITGYSTTNMGPITVNAGGTLTTAANVRFSTITANFSSTFGGWGNLQSDATVAGTFTPTASGAGTGMGLSSLTLNPTAVTSFVLSGTAAANYGHVTVTNQLGVAGTLNVSLGGGYTPNPGSWPIFTYGSLSSTGTQFGSVNLPAVPNASTHPNWSWSVNYGTGTASQVSVGLNSAPWYFTGGAYNSAFSANADYTHPYWAVYANWTYNASQVGYDSVNATTGYKPGFDPANPDVVNFDDAHLDPAYIAANSTQFQTNIHDVGPSNGPGFVQEMRVNTSATNGWYFYNNNRMIAFKNPTAGQQAKFTQNGSGPVRFDDNLRLDSDTLFSGSGTGMVTVNGCVLLTDGVSSVLRSGVTGTGGLILGGSYKLVLNNAASYQGTTTINAGTLLFNAETATPNLSWTSTGTANMYNPTTQGAVTVNAGGTLGGNGKLHAPVEIKSGGFLSPGDSSIGSAGSSAGIFTADSLTLDAGSSSLIELGGTTVGTGSGHYDQMAVGGALGLHGTLNVSLVNGFTPTLGQTFTIFTYAGTLSNAFDTLNLPTVSGGVFAINYGTGTNSQITLTTVVPEPSVALMTALGTLGMVLLYRRRRKTRIW